MNSSRDIEYLNSSISYLNLNRTEMVYNGKVPDINCTNLMEIYVIPSLDRNLDDRFFELQQVNLTWLAINYTQQYLHI